MRDQSLKTEEFLLEGFHCKDCAETIVETVQKLGGVDSAQANFTTSKLRVRYDPIKTRLEDLVNSVEKIGYRVKHDGAKVPEKRIFWKEREFVFTLLSGLLLGIGLGLKFVAGNPVLLEFSWGNFAAATIFYFAAIVFGAFFFSREGWAAIRNLKFNMDFLMSLAIVGACIIGEYVEAASLAFLFSLAELLEGYAVERARNSLRALMNLAPEVATVKRNGQEVTIPVAEIKLGDRVVVRPGGKLAVDGVVVGGASSLDQSLITGESIPVLKEKGEQVYAGSINVEGFLEVQANKTPENTMLARIINMVEEAEAQKAPSERFVEKFAKYYTPSIVALAVGVAVVPPLFLGAVFHLWFGKALTLLVIACPCALVISTPVSVVSALTNASRNGILIKGGVHLENMAKIKAIALDKTGTLTKGRLKVTDVLPVNGQQRNEVLLIAASLESKSEHPIAKAILEASDGQRLLETRNFTATPGKGVQAEIEGTPYYVGRPDVFEAFSIELPTQQLHALQAEGKTTMLLGKRTQIMGIIALRDEIREGGISTVAKLKASGKEVVMITGDNPETARAIAQRLGIDHFHAALLPQEKVEEIKHLQKKYGKVAMVGDGINDAPALAAASVGIAMGVAGTDTALETADIALMSDDLTQLPYLVAISQRARTVIKQNIWTSILLKFSLAIGVFPGVVSLVVAVLIGDMGASLAVTTNALRLARNKSV
ncbi:MAG: heavy metal translocating P-type ATPase [bacterium]